MAAITWRNSRNRPATKQHQIRKVVTLLGGSVGPSKPKAERPGRGPSQPFKEAVVRQDKSLDAPWPESGRRLLSKGTRTLPARLHLESLG
ncbi:hypothetical protein WJX84_000519 [Apatococcus fuscideae]|uniref:Uncharacterized protein n=1 Tax=Apatococcus fuscideae TaxID=2026836 RepID=A0AAW1T427_9CHLO